MNNEKNNMSRTQRDRALEAIGYVRSHLASEAACDNHTHAYGLQFRRDLSNAAAEEFEIVYAAFMTALGVDPKVCPRPGVGVSDVAEVKS